jgi:hypothetical protein
MSVSKTTVFETNKNIEKRLKGHTFLGRFIYCVNYG